MRRSPKLLGEILIGAGVLTRARLLKLLAAQPESGLRLGELAVAEGCVSAKDVRNAVARQWSMGEVDPLRAPPDPALLANCDVGACLRIGCLPWRRVGDTVVIALAEPDAMRAAQTACGIGPARPAFALADLAMIREALARGLRERLARRAASRTPSALSVRSWSDRSGRGALVFLTAFVAAGLVFGAGGVFAAILIWSVVCNLATMLVRSAALILSLLPKRGGPSASLIRLSRFRPPPRVSVLVPLYKETAVIDPLLTALTALDYPAALLDIILVIEEDDLPMRNALAARQLPTHVRVLAAPLGAPRTKPRAMNYALDFTLGEIVGIYDAEDQPDPGQIRAVVDEFAEAPPQIACVQARLGYYNTAQNWLARCFAIEYASWFDVLLPGIQRLGMPVPLGGTSVFFRRRALEEAGAWDAHNVTEDADLGMRLARLGYKTRVIASTTLEEANCRPSAWIKQRSRWLKGFVATWITHMRDARGLWAELGPMGFFGFQVILLGGATAYLSLPFLWLLWASIAIWGSPSWIAAMPAGLLDVFWLSLVAGQIVMLGVALRALAVTGQRRLLPAILYLPLYWPLGAVAAWRAVIELARAPLKWHKTQHGISGRYMARAAENTQARATVTPQPPALDRGGRRARDPDAAQKVTGPTVWHSRTRRSD
ncbi:MAG: glycosyltransferase [Pseudomonadota bacterium]